MSEIYYNVPFLTLFQESAFVEYMKYAVDGVAPPTPAPPPPPEEFWKDLPNGEHVHYMKHSAFDDILRSKTAALVMFYAPCE